jgi:hypothetical protein
MSEPPASARSTYVTPDGTLTLIVEREQDDIILGFEGTPWHTHGDLLALEHGLPPEAAVARFVDTLLEKGAVIAIVTAHGVVRDVWVPDEPLKSDPYKPDDEVVTFRFWDGTPFDPGGPAPKRTSET